MTENDLDALEALANAQLVQCGSCDFGLVEYGCTCPKADPRPVISQLLEAVRTLRYNIRIGRMTCDISAALRRLAVGRPEIASLLVESADKLDDLLTSLAQAETARDKYQKLFGEKVVDRRRLVGLMREDGHKIRQLEGQRDQVLAHLDEIQKMGTFPGGDFEAAAKWRPADTFDAIRAIYASTAHPSSLEAQK